MANQLEVINITKNYGAFKALNKVSLGVQKGKIIGLLGPNGAGKTSLIRIITQITQPDSGTILFNNEPLAPSHGASVGYLPEERGLYKKMEVAEQLIYLAQLKGVSKKNVSELINYWVNLFELNKWSNKKIEELSKGMQQKVQFIAAVMLKPELLILDEPFSGFDPINANLITEEILKLKQSGTTIIFSTHRMETVEQLCDDIVLINKSEKILDGNLQEIKQQFKKNIFQLQSIHPITTNNQAFQILSHQNQHNLNTYTLAKNQNVTNNQIINELVKQTEIISFAEVLPSINDIFVELVNAKQL